MKGEETLDAEDPEQIVGKLRDADAMLTSGKTIGQACQALEVGEQTFHRWRAQCGGMKAEEARRLKHLEEESKRLNELFFPERHGAVPSYWEATAVLL